jgi:hypothetical protein
MSTYVEGIIDAVRKDGRGFQVNGVWYGGMDQYTFKQADHKGLTVAFEWEASQDGKWKNIQTYEFMDGTPQQQSPQQNNYQQPQRQQQRRPQQRPQQQQQQASQQQSAPMYEDGMFVSRNTSIIRQTCVKAAAQVLTNIINMDQESDQVGQAVVAVAKELEYYCTGAEDEDLRQQAANSVRNSG